MISPILAGALLILFTKKLRSDALSEARILTTPLNFATEMRYRRYSDPQKLLPTPSSSCSILNRT